MRPILRQSTVLLPLLALPCGLQQSAYDADPSPKRAYELEYTVDLPQAGPGTVLWVPIPREDGVQTVEILESPDGAVVSEPDLHGNRYASLTAPAQTRHTWRYRIQRRTDTAGVTTNGQTATYLDADNLVPVDGEAAARAAEASSGRRGTGAVTRALYDRVLADMTYNKAGTGWGTGSTQWACAEGYGNCTDFHALFISMSRSREIPARFTIGFSLPPAPERTEVKGYHCWAHFYDSDAGWTPVDISEADKDPSKVEFFYSTLDPDRVSMTSGRDLVLDPPQQGAPLNYFVRAYAEQDGQPLEAKTTIQVTDLPE